MIDEHGFRPNVGIVVANSRGQVLWARRRGQTSWQFPQGGVQEGEAVDDALFRELHEEVGLERDHVAIVSRTSSWLHYRLPGQYIRRNSDPNFVGQKQKWYLLQMLAPDDAVRTDLCRRPEFDHWRWVSYWYPLTQIVAFKRDVYRRAMNELAPSHSRLVHNAARR